MSGTVGRTVVAEMLSTTQDAKLFSLLHRGDQTQMHRWFRTRPKTLLTDPDMQGKSALECALYKMSTGQIDPREVEANFGVFLCRVSSESSHA
jgi:general secretion pathway protein E